MCVNGCSGGGESPPIVSLDVAIFCYFFLFGFFPLFRCFGGGFFRFFGEEGLDGVLEVGFCLFGALAEALRVGFSQGLEGGEFFCGEGGALLRRGF